MNCEQARFIHRFTRLLWHTRRSAAGAGGADCYDTAGGMQHLCRSTCPATADARRAQVAAPCADAERVIGASDIEQPLHHPAVLGVAGRPEVVANSLSPRMMRAAFEALGMDAHYVPLPIRDRSAGKALRALARLGFRGCNVTMPYKHVAAEIAHTRSALVERTGVANTLLVRPDGTIHAHATDGVAVLEALAARDIEVEGKTITIIGAGGAATEAAVALADAGAARLHLWNRTRDRADQLAGTLQKIAPALVVQVHDEMPIGEASRVVIGCVPADALVAEVLTDLHRDALIVDFAYRRDGRATPMMVAAANRSEACVDGRELLVRQGAAAFRLWFGVEPPIEVMTRAVR